MSDHEGNPDSPNAATQTVELPRPSGDTPDDRICMACRQPFLSEGWHNRLCPRCRKRSEPDGW